METKTLIEQCIGLSYAEASKLCEENGFTCRIECVDGKFRMVTQDIKGNRLSFTTESDIVVSARIK